MSDWALATMDRLMHRVERTREQVGERFPLHADPADGRWVTTRRGSWTGGFWAGLLALRAHGEPGPETLAAALAARERLADWAVADTVCRGMIFWYGETATWTGLVAPTASTWAAADGLVGSFAPDLGAIPWGAAFGPDPAPDMSTAAQT